MKILVLGITLILLAGCAGMTPIKPEDKTFSQIFESPGQPKDFLYEKVRDWMALNFKSSDKAIEYENKQEGTIIGHGSIKYPCVGLECLFRYDWTVPFTMRVETKDNKFSLTYSNLRIDWPPHANSLSYRSAGDTKINLQGDLDHVKPVLLRMGKELQTNLAMEVKTENR